MLNETGFGKDAKEMDRERFMRNKGLERPPYYRPFSGGIVLCTGRYIARREVLGFLAIALWRFDMEVVGRDETLHGDQGEGLPGAGSGEAELGDRDSGSWGRHGYQG